MKPATAPDDIPLPTNPENKMYTIEEARIELAELDNSAYQLRMAHDRSLLRIGHKLCLSESAIQDYHKLVAKRRSL